MKAKMVFCLCEAKKRAWRVLLKQSVFLSLLRDESASSGLLVLFRASAWDLTECVGMIGCELESAGSATRINDATYELMVRFCTPLLGAPHAEVEPCLDVDLFLHIRSIVKVGCVDAAGNEVAAVLDSAVPHTSSDAARFPNQCFCIRDRAHASRRVIEPWNADPYISDMIWILVKGPQSLAQQIQHSKMFREWYAEECDASGDRAVSTVFHNMRAALHRLETVMTPLPRHCLNPRGSINFLQRILRERAGKEAATTTDAVLETMDEEQFVQAAMRADGGLDALTLIRHFDGAPLASSCCRAIKRFLDVGTEMCLNRRVLVCEGHTLHMLHFLETQHRFWLKNGVKSVGGPGTVTPEIIVRCLKRMQVWMCLARDTLRAEHPDFEVVSALAAFDLEDLPPHAEDIAPVVVTDIKHNLQRLGSAFCPTACVEDLWANFCCFFVYAVKHRTRGAGNNESCRRSLIDRTCSSPTEDFQTLLVANAGIGVVTTDLERRFSVYRRVFGEQSHGPTRETS